VSRESSQELQQEMKLKRDANIVLRVHSVTALASVNLASSSFASNIPSAFDVGAVLSFAKSGAAATRFQLGCGVKTLIVPSQAGNRTSFESRWATSNTSGALMVIVVAILVIAGLGGWMVLRWTGWSGTWLAFVLLLVPFPAVRALRRLGIARWGLTWSTAALVFVPVVSVLGTLGIGWRRWWILGASMRQATALVTPPEISTLAVGGHDEGNESGKKDNVLEKHG